MHFRFWLFVLVTFFRPFLSHASFDFNSNCKTAYEKVFALEFIEAQKILALEKKANPLNSIPHLIENYIECLTTIIDEQKSDFEKLKVNKQKRFEFISTHGDPSSPFFRYSKAELNIQIAASRLKFNEYISAAWEIKSAYSLLKENQKLFPDFILNKKSLGLLHIMIGSVPAEYKWITDLLGFEGSVKQGLSEITEFAKAVNNNDEFRFLKIETIILLSYLKQNFSSEFKSSDFFDWNQNEIITNPLLNFVVTNHFIHEGKNDQALETVSKFIGKTGQFKLHYLNYLRGVCLLNKLDTVSQKYFQIYVKDYKGTSYVKSAFQRIAWISLIQNDIKGYEQNITKVRLKGDLLLDEDKQANNEATKKIKPNVTLLKARLLFDGGYFNHALKVLNEAPAKSFISLKDQLEFTYRLGRIYQKLNDFNKALSAYQNTIEKGKESSYYYACNAALQLGNLYEKQGKNGKAIEYYKLCLNLNPDEYKTSLHQKAKAGLDRLK